MRHGRQLLREWWWIRHEIVRSGMYFEAQVKNTCWWITFEKSVKKEQSQMTCWLYPDLFLLEVSFRKVLSLGKFETFLRHQRGEVAEISVEVRGEFRSEDIRVWVILGLVQAGDIGSPELTLSHKHTNYKQSNSLWKKLRNWSIHIGWRRK